MRKSSKKIGKSLERMLGISSKNSKGMLTEVWNITERKMKPKLDQWNIKLLKKFVVMKELLRKKKERLEKKLRKLKRKLIRLKNMLRRKKLMRRRDVRSMNVKKLQPKTGK